jgi:predicted nucleic acid-binding protein
MEKEHVFLSSRDFQNLRDNSPVDGEIAAFAWANSMAIATRNTSDFELFENIKVLNWHKNG